VLGKMLLALGDRELCSARTGFEAAAPAAGAARTDHRVAVPGARPGLHDRDLVVDWRARRMLAVDCERRRRSEPPPEVAARLPFVL
jgi:hypothetical protein